MSHDKGIGANGKTTRFTSMGHQNRDAVSPFRQKPDLKIKADSYERSASLEERIAGIGRGIEEIQARASDH